MKKISCFFAVLMLLLSVIVSQLIPVFAETIPESTTETTMDSLQKSDDTLETSADRLLPEGEDSGSRVKDETFVEETADESEETQTAPSTSETESHEPAKAAARQARANLSNQIEVLEWRISNAKGEEVSETVAAVSNQAHDFSFKVQLDQMIKGDTFALDIPQVGGASKENDHWYMQSTDWIEVTDDQETVFYRYRIQQKTGTHTQEIQFEAMETSLTPLELELDFPGMLSNFVKTAGVFPVTFGKDDKNDPITKAIKFDVTDLKASNGFSFKYNTSTSKNSVKWGIRFNEAANIELSGDEVDYKVNGGKDNPYQGFYRDNPLRKPENWHEWGKNYTDIWSPDISSQGNEANYGGYIEDELPAGAEVTELTIGGLINLPMGLSASDLEAQTGGIPSSTIAYQSYVLADYGKGPIYRNAGDTGTLRPKAGTGFTLLKQKAGESKSDFKDRVQSQPYQYGIYQDGAGRKTVMLHFGNMKRTGNQQERLQDQTNQEYSGKTFTDKDGATHQIPQFAVEAASATIGDQRSGYTENERDLLERYFTLTYGESNAIGGSIAAYNITLNVRYPPETAGEVSNNADIYTHSALTLNRTTPERMPKSNPSKATLKNPNAHIQLSKTEVMLQKLDADLFADNGDYIGINGAEFKLQKKVGTAWEDVGNPVKKFTTADYTYRDEEGDKLLPGIIKIDVAEILGVSGSTLKDTFRFVETKAPAGFSERDSPNWNNQAQAIVSDEFTLASSTSQGATVVVWNRHKEVTYKVEHWVQKEGFDGSDISHFERVVTEEKPGLVGDKVYGQPLDHLQVTHYYNANFTAQHGKPNGNVTDTAAGEPELVLKLYYTKDKDVPFTLYKLGMDGQPLRRTETAHVTFKVYRFMYVEGTNRATHPPTPENITAGYWRRVVVNPDNSLKSTTVIDPLPDLELTTDELGRIRDERLVFSTAFGAQLALVEVENTHPDYQVPPIEENYWVVQIKNPSGFDWVEGYGTKKTGKVKYRPEGTAVDYWAIPNRFDVEPTIYKVDENNDPMPSDDEKSVEFDVYEYIGPEADRPDKVTDAKKDHNNPLAAGYKNNWNKLTGSPYTTNAEGKLVDLGGNPINLAPDKVYSFIERKTYDGYQLPNNHSFSTNRTSHWLVSPSGNLQSGFSGYVDSRPAQWLDSFYENAAGSDVRPEGIYLKNKKLTKIPIFKVDGDLNPITQHSADSFKFETFLYQGSSGYQTTELGTGSWKKISGNTLSDSFDSSGSGRLFTEDDSLETKVGRTEVVKEQIVGIREVKGMHDYVTHDGHWVVKLLWDPVAKVNKVTSIEYFENGQLITGADSTIYHERLNGEAYLKNQKVPTYDFSFIKENERQKPLGNVAFALYKERNTTGSEDPNAADTRWDLSEEPYREAVSSLDIGDLGRVSFKALIEGSYLLVETKTVDGYNLPQGYWILTVNDQGKVTIRGSTDPPPPAFYERDEELYLPNYRETIMPKAGGIGLHTVVSIGIVLLGLSALVFLEIYKRQLTEGIRFVSDKLKK